MPGRGHTPENELSCSFSEVVGGGDGQRKVNLPKTSRGTCFGSCGLVVVARESQLLEYKPWHLFLEVVSGGGGCQRGQSPKNKL